MSTLNQPSIEHVCGYCERGYLLIASPTNPAKTDKCVICGHHAEGVNREVTRNKFGQLKAVPTSTNIK